MSLKKNFIYNLIYQILIVAIPVFTTPYISRVIKAEGMGRFSYSYSIVYYFILFGLLGVNNYGSRTIASVRDNKDKLYESFWEIYTFQIFTSIISLLFYCIYVVFFSNDRTIALILMLYLIGTCLDINWFFSGLEKFSITITRDIIIKISTVICIFVFVKSLKDIYIYAFIYSFGMFLSQIFLWINATKLLKFKKIDFDNVYKHIKPNLILFIPTIAISLYKTMDKIMLGYITTKIQVGYYEACEKILMVPTAFVVALGTVIMPRIANLIANNNESTAKNFFRKSVIFSILCTSSISFGIMAVSREFVPVFYGKGFDTCVKIFQFIMPTCIFVGVANVMRTQFLIPFKRDKIYVISVFLGAFINLAMNLIFIPKLGAIGAAIGTLTAEAMVCIYQYFEVKKYTNIKQDIKDGIPFILFSIVMYLIITFIPKIVENTFLMLVIKITIGFIVFLSMCFVYFNAIKNQKH